MKRHLASPFEVVAALRESVVDPADLVSRSSEWGELSLVEMDFKSAGTFVTAPIAYYSVSTFTGADSYLAEDGSRSRPPRVPRHATLIHQAGRGAHYVWASPHRARMACLAPSVVARAAEEVAITKVRRVEILSSFDVRDRVCEHIVQALAAEARLAPHFTQRLVVESLASALALRLLGRYNAFPPRRLAARGGLSAQVLERVQEYMHESTVEISLDQLAKLSGLSRFHFARQFRASTGESPMGYVRRMRVERVKSLLCEQRSSIADIAAQVGFADQSHLTRVFRRLVGLTPTEFSSRHGRRAKRGLSDGDAQGATPTGTPRPARG